MEKTYNEFTSVEEVRKYYNITESVITEVNQETKDPDNKKEEEEETPSELLPVIYADIKPKSYNNIFDHWVVFTNSKDPKSNKTLGNILEAIDKIKKSGNKEPELHLFLAEKTIATETENKFEITDDDETLDFSDLNNSNTVIFSRLGVQGEGNCEQILNIIQDKGFLVLNPLQSSQIASDKYKTAIISCCPDSHTKKRSSHENPSSYYTSPTLPAPSALGTYHTST